MSTTSRKDDTTPILEVQDLSVEFWVGGDWVPAAKDINYVVRPGEVLAIVGESGSGKSTVLHVLAGFLEPATGEVSTADGRRPARLDPPELAAAIAWIPQWASSTIVTNTVLDEVMVTSRSIGREDDTTKERALALRCPRSRPCRGRGPSHPLRR